MRDCRGCRPTFAANCGARSKEDWSRLARLGLTGDKWAPRGHERTLEVNCSNCGAKFVAYYGADEDDLETVEVSSRGLCHGEAFRRDNFKGATIRLMAQVTALERQARRLSGGKAA